MTTTRYDDLRREYIDLFSRISIKPSWDARTRAMAEKVIANKARYRIIEDALGTPWFFVGCLHAMESGCRFGTHLHNGDPLTARTRRVPAGRPARGAAPFSWEDSARDALQLKSLQQVADWTLSRMLYEAERYNGWGYRKYHRHVLSPYLWSGTPLYRRGKYIADGKWSEEAISQQVGFAPLLMTVAELDNSVLLDVHPSEVDLVPVDEDVPEPEEDVVATPEAFPKAEEPRVVEATRKSRTITGAIFAGIGSIVVYLEDALKGGFSILTDAAAQFVEWSPITTLMSHLGANLKTVGLAIATGGILLVVARRIRAAVKGKIG